ncbi:MAG: hypothetical protein GY938_19160 [Ketobacter sp.]|nr:hypothetical protein [Ketobacter sp.]
MIDHSDKGIFFLDEVGFNLSMRTKKGRALKGKTPTICVPLIRSKNFSVCGIYSKTGMVYHEIVKGSYNGDRFSEFITNFMEYYIMKKRRNC